MADHLNRRFYSDITASTLSLKDLLLEIDSFQILPDNWDIIVTDIVNSTAAFNMGKYQEINLIAASSIIAALNVGKKYNLDLPFIFGGDGVTLCAPAYLTPEIYRHILGLKAKTLKHFKLDLRVGFVPAMNVYAEGRELRINKIKVTDHYHQAVFLGDGLLRAETIVKKTPATGVPTKKTEPNLEGLECRWQEIPSPHDKPQIMSLIIVPRDHVRAGAILSCVLTLIDNYCGDFASRHPLSHEGLELSASAKKIHRETILKNKYFTGLRTAKKILEAWVGKQLLKYRWSIRSLDGKNYKDSLILASDTLKVDGSLKTIISGTKTQFEQLLLALRILESEGKIFFGHYITSHSFLTCFVADRHTRHIHFLDAKNGGYTLASIELKAKLAHEHSSV